MLDPLAHTTTHIYDVHSRLAETRDPLYRSIASITIRTDGRAPAAVAGDIARALQGS